jgi:hypothetical protein
MQKKWNIFILFYFIGIDNKKKLGNCFFIDQVILPSLRVENQVAA